MQITYSVSFCISEIRLQNFQVLKLGKLPYSIFDPNFEPKLLIDDKNLDDAAVEMIILK